MNADSRSIPALSWSLHRFSDLTTDHLFEILQLRIDTFVVEQRCAYREVEADDRHPETRHLCARDPREGLIAYARILPPGLRGPEVILGRLVVTRAYRGRGLGHRLVESALEVARTGWPGSDVRLAAQRHLERFYERHGFVPVSEVFLEDGIPHVTMVKHAR